MRIIVTARKADWVLAKGAGTYTKSSVDLELDEVGFIHASLPGQVMAMVNRRYQGFNDLVFLFVDPAKVRPEIVYERPFSGRAGIYPHIYGPLNTDAVTQEVPLTKLADGNFRAPRALEEIADPSLEVFFHYGGITLGRIADSDIDRVVAFINDAYSYQDKYKDTSRTCATDLREKARKHEVYVAKRDGALAGCLYTKRDGHTLFFGLLAVARDLRGKGLGPAIINAVEDYARALGIDKLQLNIMSISPWLKPYYERFGFVSTGEVTNWGTIDLIDMAKELT